MLDKSNLHALIETTRQHINLRETVIEKDYYVTQVIHALSGIENEYFRLVFCGGTCLAKAHKLVKRMSEDVDFKIQLKVTDNFNRSQLKKEIKQLREEIKLAVSLPGFTIAEDAVRNEGKYQRIILKYPCLFPVSLTLRPDIMLEFTFSHIRLSVNELRVKTLIEEVLKEVNLFISPSTKCLSIDETAIEKWVGLTRRIIAIERKYHFDDSTLVRHVYDLNSIILSNKINNSFITLAKTIVNNDAKQFKNQHPEYFIDPGSEIRKSLELLRNKISWKERYQEFIETMVYDDISVLEYDQAMKNLEGISDEVINSIRR